MDKRVVGFGMGWGHWQETLATVQEPELLVTDGETGVAELAEWYFSGTRHQRCEWHLSYGLGHALGKDGLSVEERKPLAGKLSGILARGGAKARTQYREFTDRMRNHPSAHSLLTNAEPYPLLSTILGAHDQRHGARDARGQPTHRRGGSLEHPWHLQSPQAPAGETT